tara:strand:+ start:26402 stop:27262 length:861 start_codon:yes stop_codon:yes gene_type:complete
MNNLLYYNILNLYIIIMSQPIQYKKTRKVPYLNLYNPEIDSSYNYYIRDLNNIDTTLQNDDDVQSTYNSYKTYRADIMYDSDNEEMYDLDIAVIDALKTDKEYLFNNNKNNSQEMRAIMNRIRNLDNNDQYNAALNKMVQDDISNTLVDIKDMTQNLNNKKRYLEIRNYYDKKMNDHIYIFKVVVFICLVMLLISFIYKSGLLPDSVFVTLIGLGISIIVIYTIGKLIDIFLRDGYNYDEYNYYVRGEYYLKKDLSGNDISDHSDIPLYEQEDIISNKCLNIMNKS